MERFPQPSVETVQIQYLGVWLEVPACLKDLWPYDMDLEDWPTFCGAGEGIGDVLVPDKIEGAIVSPACFAHDIAWAISQRTHTDFFDANIHLLHNLNNLIAKFISHRNHYERAIRVSFGYWEAVTSILGWANFEPCGSDPWTNPVVKARLKKLADAKIKLAKV